MTSKDKTVKTTDPTGDEAALTINMAQISQDQDVH
jgi:hypothetical protein